MMAIDRYPKHLLTEYRINVLDLIINLDKLDFKELIIVANGQVESEVVFQYINGEKKLIAKKDDERSSIDIEDEEVIFKERLEHVKTMFDDPRNEKVDLSYY